MPRYEIINEFLFPISPFVFDCPGNISAAGQLHHTLQNGFFGGKVLKSVISMTYIYFKQKVFIKH